MPRKWQSLVIYSSIVVVILSPGARPLTRTVEEVQQEIASLRDLSGRVASTTAFGDSNDDAIDAQIRVLDEKLTFEQVVDEYEDVAYTLSSALDAYRWLNEDDEPVSTGWRELVTAETETEVEALVS